MEVGDQKNKRASGHTITS